ncbi:MAG TPA: methyltransferase domain-containing protein [Vicinamibacterales bacterium]
MVAKAVEGPSTITPVRPGSPALSLVVPVAAPDVPDPGFLVRASDAAHRLGVTSEIVVAVPPSLAAAVQAQWPGQPVLSAGDEGFGSVLARGLQASRGEWVLTLDADLRDPAQVIAQLWSARDGADIVIGSRLVPGGVSHVPGGRRLLSGALNRIFSRGLSLSVQDMSSGHRLYRRSALPGTFHARGFDLLQEILVRAYAEGWRVREIPIDYEPIHPGHAYRRLLNFGLDYLRTFWSLWKLRNSILAADYDDRAHDSAIPLQRYWQRQRFRHITELIGSEGPVLDVGCGSSRIIGALPRGSIGLDVLQRKLRYARKFGRALVHGSGFNLPFPDGTFPVVLCSQVIEHVPKESPILAELCRVLAPGGRLVLGTPDYARPEWVITEKLYGFFAPGGYADEHIAHYTREELIARFTAMGWTHEATRYILRGELILAFRKPAAGASSPAAR